MNRYDVTVIIDLDAESEEDARAIADSIVSDGSTAVERHGDHVEDFYITNVWLQK